MIRINLLPHRQIKRAERQRQFNLMLGATAIAGAVVVFLGYTIIGSKIDAQGERNQRLNVAIAKLDKEIEEIKELKARIHDVLDRKQAVENLQANRSQSVILLDELSRQLPEGIYYKTVKQQANLINLTGIADTNARIAALVRNFSSSDSLESPGLVEIKAVSVNNLRLNDFTMNVKLKAKKPPEDGSNPTVNGKKS